jgi:diguanylate cyclase (GGDEF)-like protein/putative nucleotidyltransferase with HDIG domain
MAPCLLCAGLAVNAPRPDRMIMRFRELPVALQALVILHGLALVAAGWLVVVAGPPHDPVLLALLLTTAALLAMVRCDVRLLHGRVYLELTPAAAALVLLGPAAAVLAAVTGAAAALFTRGETDGWRVSPRLPLGRELSLGLGSTAAAGALGGLFYAATKDLLPNHSLSLLLALGGFACAFFLVNAGGTALADALHRRARFRDVWVREYRGVGAGYVVACLPAAAVEPHLWSVGAFTLLLAPLVGLAVFSYRALHERLRRDARHVAELNQLNQAIIASLATAIDAKDRYTCSHIHRVQHYAVSLAKAAGLAGPDLEAVSTGALVHDIGKLGVPDRILGKPGKLTAEEFKRIQGHVTIGADILSPIPFPFPLVEVVLTHHERWDGLGYPRGLKGDQIPIGGRIISLADVFDALTSDRPYRRAMTHAEALAELRQAAGRQFDPALVELFARIQPAAAREIEALEAASPTPGVPARLEAPFVRISQAAAEMAAVSDIAHALAEQDTVDQIAATVVNRALALLPADTAVLYLREPESPGLEAVAVDGKCAAKLEGMTVQLGEGVAGWVAAHQQPRVNVSASLDIARRFAPEEAIDLNAATAVPLVHGPDSLGTLAVYTTGYSVLADHHVRVLNIIAEHAAAALQNTRRAEAHRELAFTDPLTGLTNSRGLVRHLDRLMYQTKRSPGAGFSVVMLDIDRFKQVNDTLGHLRGDDLLREIADLLVGVARPHDIACRYAGDEFVLLLPGADRAYAEGIAGQLREAVAAVAIPECPVGVGASIGVAGYPADGIAGRELIHVADRRMYEDKFNRRRTSALLDSLPGESLPGAEAERTQRDEPALTARA